MTTPTSAMSRLCKSIRERGATYDRNGDLPLPNIYLCTVYPFEGQQVSSYVAADHTRLALHKVCNRMVDSHKFRPMRSNSTIKVRRLLLGDIIENPSAYDQALSAAKAANESDIVATLRRLPQWLSAHIQVPQPSLDDSALSSLWDNLSRQISDLRPAH